MEESQNKRAVIVGLFILLGLAFLMGGILMVGNLHETFKKKIQLITIFDDVNGLQKGANIWFSGVKIGTVGNISIDKKLRITVELHIEKKSQEYIRKNASVKIGTDGLIGNKVVIIYGGTSKVRNVQEGDTLSVQPTFSTDNLMNTLQKNNENLLSITSDFKKISNRMASNHGTIGKLLSDDSLYNNLNAVAASLNQASVTTNKMVGSLNNFSAKLNNKGTLAHELVTDTTVYNSIKKSVTQLREMSESANTFVNNLKETGKNPNSPIGVLLHDEESGAELKRTIKNLESSSEKLNEDLEAAQHNFLLRGYFKDKNKAAKK